jgi:hypothetical protein
MSMPTFYAYFNALGECVAKGNSQMFSWKAPRTDRELKDESLGALFQMAGRAQRGERSLEDVQSIVSVQINGTEPTFSLDTLVDHVRSGEYQVGCTRNFSGQLASENPPRDPVRDVLSQVFPAFKLGT